MYWDSESIVVNPNSYSNDTPIVSNDTDGSTNTKLTWTATLNLPGDFYEFTIDAVNSGTLDAMITNINEELPDDLKDYISCTISYESGIAPARYHKLPKAKVKNNVSTPTRHTYKVRVEFLDTVTSSDLDEIPEGGLSYNFTYEVTYGQADEHAIAKPTIFGIGTWDQIIAAYNNGNPMNDLYDSIDGGETREVK